jgi:hypothetical protein
VSTSINANHRTRDSNAFGDRPNECAAMDARALDAGIRRMRIRMFAALVASSSVFTVALAGPTAADPGMRAGTPPYANLAGAALGPHER